MVGTPYTAHFQVTGGTSRGIRPSEPPTHARAGILVVPCAREQRAAARTA